MSFNEKKRKKKNLPKIVVVVCVCACFFFFFFFVCVCVCENLMSINGKTILKRDFIKISRVLYVLEN